MISLFLALKRPLDGEAAIPRESRFGRWSLGFLSEKSGCAVRLRLWPRARELGCWYLEGGGLREKDRVWIDALEMPYVWKGMIVRVFSILHATANLDDNLTACIADTGLLVIPLGQARVHLTCICTCMYVLYHLDGKTEDTHT